MKYVRGLSDQNVTPTFCKEGKHLFDRLTTTDIGVSCCEFGVSGSRDSTSQCLALAEAIQRQFERFERIHDLAAGDGRDVIISNSHPRPSYCPQNQLYNRENKQISDVELLGTCTLMRPSDTHLCTAAESSRISPHVGSSRASLTRTTINQDLMDRLDDILDMVSLSKSVQ